MPAPDDATAARLPGRLREARANDTAVLDAARELFSEQGNAVSMADIARRAGVGVGSVYRRYPTKDALVDALRLEGVRDVARLAASIADALDAAGGSTPREPRGPGAVETFVARHITGARGPMLRPTGARRPLSPELAAASEELRAALERLVAHDRSARLVPEGFTTADAMQLLVHLRPPLPYPRAQVDALHLRYLALVVRGLREAAHEGTTLEGGPRWDEWVGTWQD
ncbi:TetR family transcriptional regulator [Luteimicrobium album]|uniref:TetR family transcriptional regulator n=1 Tax=Luteimicrobium album TaxID=1054550 RepID=A0ABQ6HV99_9MICO|nr:TetR/AcrR family transcriptional regulator [Luteimicrobium album]GMA22449.1 TetR family transcriptional regulator [Luteimicrobium album]